MAVLSPFSVGVVADDLTSATDGAGPFLARGYTPVIVNSADSLDVSGVVSINTDSRASPVEAARDLVATATAALANRAILFKTIDSTLRGHIREEIAAAFRASGRRRLVVAPAFPGAGRQTIGGVQFVNGVPVDESTYGDDPVHPALTARVALLIDPTLGESVCRPETAPAEIAHRDSAPPIVILDAASQESLNRQVAGFRDPTEVLWVGSPGLAVALASIAPTKCTTCKADGSHGHRALIVVGSSNAISQAQCDTLKASGVPVATVLAGLPSNSQVVCLRAPYERRSDPGAVLSALASQSASVLERLDADVLIATGGETMAALLRGLGVTSFTLVCELEPGFPVGRALRADGRPLILAMKAGGFGGPETLQRAVQALLQAPLH